MTRLNYCPECGDALELNFIENEPRGPGFCRRCGVLRRDNPMVVVTCFVAFGKRLLFVQRNLEPRRGRWAIPGGFLERGEGLAEGAARELYEEAGVLLRPEQLQIYMTGSITFLNQVYVGFRATVDTDYCRPGRESMACRYFSRDECPWDQLAYPQVNDAKRIAFDELETGTFDVWHGEMTEDHYVLRAVSCR